MEWIDAGPLAELHDGQSISIPVGRRMVAVARSGEEYFAIEDVCTHDGAELTGGAVEGAEIVCPRHGARFCLRTGAALTPGVRAGAGVCNQDRGRAVVGPLRLTLLRHGEAQPADSCAEDFERVLTRRGSIEAQEMASRLVHRNLVPDLVLVSPAERTWTTAAIVATACELDAKQVQCARELYLATPEIIWQLVTRHDLAAKHILICAHNPGLSQIASRLGPQPQARVLRTAGMATAVWINTSWAKLEPETAHATELDDPERLANPWD